MVGGPGADTLSGDGGDDRLAAGGDFVTASDSFLDSLVGGAGNDTLFGDTVGDGDVLFQ